MNSYGCDKPGPSQLEIKQHENRVKLLEFMDWNKNPIRCKELSDECDEYENKYC